MRTYALLPADHTALCNSYGTAYAALAINSITITYVCMFILLAEICLYLYYAEVPQKQHNNYVCAHVYVFYRIMRKFIKSSMMTLI